MNPLPSLTILQWVGTMSTSQRPVMLCDWGVICRYGSCAGGRKKLRSSCYCQPYQSVHTITGCHTSAGYSHSNSYKQALKITTEHHYVCYCSVIFVLIYFFVLVLVLVCQLFFNFIFVLVLATTKEYQTCWRRRVDGLPKYCPPLVTDSTPYGHSIRKRRIVC